MAITSKQPFFPTCYGEEFIVELSNAPLTNVPGFQAPDPDLTLTIDRADLEQTMAGIKSPDAQLANGTAVAEGNLAILGQLANLMVDFDPRFEIMPGTKARTETTDNKAFEAAVGPGIPK